jgi:hypothetical protein
MSPLCPILASSPQPRPATWCDLCLSLCVSCCLSLFLSICLFLYLSVSGLDVPAVSDIGVIATTATGNLVCPLCLSVSLSVSFCLSLSVCSLTSVCGPGCPSCARYWRHRHNRDRQPGLSSVSVSLSFSLCLSLSLSVSLCLYLSVDFPAVSGVCVIATTATGNLDCACPNHSVCLFLALSHSVRVGPGCPAVSDIGVIPSSVCTCDLVQIFLLPSPASNPLTPPPSPLSLSVRKRPF